MYDSHPVYPHHAHLRWAHEPWKSVYVFSRVLTTIFVALFWAVYYALAPRSHRPRPSWSLSQVLLVKFTKRIYKVTEVAGVTWGTRDPALAPREGSLRETRFEWLPALPKELVTGFVDDAHVQCKPVGAYIWPKDCPVRPCRSSPSEKPQEQVQVATSVSADTLSDRAAATLPYSNKSSADVDVEAGGEPAPTAIGIFLHGGGYCHMSAHEKSGTSRIPRRLVKDKLFSEIYAVEYRLLQHDPIPGAIQDAAAAYAHIVTSVLGATKGPDGIYHYSDVSILDHSKPSLSRKRASGSRSSIEGESKPSYSPPLNASRSLRPKVILIGDSAGGNLVLALARWIRDEGLLPPPDGMLLLSPSCDPSHTLPLVPSSEQPRPHSSTDYLLDTPEPRAILQRTFLGKHAPEMVYSPYVSPASEWVLTTFHGPADAAPLPNPHICLPAGHGLFTNFAPALVVVGDAERLEREVVALGKGMERDGVRVRMVWAPDAVHDLLMLATWDEKVREQVWRDIGQWMKDLEAGAV